MSDADEQQRSSAPVPGIVRHGRVHVLVTGLLMGAADVVPGFSGGTVALVSGIYPRLIASIRATAHVGAVLLTGRWRRLFPALRRIDVGFVLTLLGGIVLAVFTLASTLTRLLDEQPVVMGALFLGLVLGAAVVARRELHAPLGPRVVLVAFSAAATFIVLGLRPAPIADPSLLLVGVAAAIAVCATILPGVSGSFLLLLIGVYQVILAAVDQRDLVTIAVVGVGAVLGLSLFASLLHRLLARHHDVVLAVLIGLMFGSARVLWPWPAGLSDTTLGRPDGQIGAAALAALLAFVAVFALGRLANRRAPA
jgi:putative membrane protein